ncbi:uncharacterized protein V6R79_025607 [Siganus canaliculatus]
MAAPSKRSSSLQKQVVKTNALSAASVSVVLFYTDLRWDELIRVRRFRPGCGGPDGGRSLNRWRRRADAGTKEALSESVLFYLRPESGFCSGEAAGNVPRGLAAGRLRNVWDGRPCLQIWTGRSSLSPS